MVRNLTPLPETMRCPETGSILRRDVRPYVVRFKGLESTVDLPGYYPDDEGESIHVGEDMAAADQALRLLKAGRRPEAVRPGFPAKNKAGPMDVDPAVRS